MSFLLFANTCHHMIFLHGTDMLGVSHAPTGDVWLDCMGNIVWINMGGNHLWNPYLMALVAVQGV